MRQPLEGTPTARACVVGASGFAGALTAAIAWGHPHIALEAVTARSDVGRRLDDLYPRHRVPLELEPYDAERLAERAEVAFVSYPHGAAATVVAELRALGHAGRRPLGRLSPARPRRCASAGTANTEHPRCRPRRCSA